MELKELIRKYSVILKDLEYSKYQMNLALRKGNKGKYQSLSLHIKYLKRKLSGISRSLKNLIHGTRTDVKFQLGSDLYEASFNNLSEQDQHQQINAFINSKIPEYINSDLSSIDYFEKLKNSDLQASYLQAIKSTCQQVECEPLILVARAGTLSEAATEELIKAIRFLIIGMAICLAMILRAEVDNKAVKNKKKKSY